MERVCRVLGLGDGGPHYRRTLLDPPEVMTSKKPAKGRWRAQEGKVLEAVGRLDEGLTDELCGERAQWI